MNVPHDDAEFCPCKVLIWSTQTMRPRHSSRNLLCLPVWFSFLKSLSALGDNSLLFFFIWLWQEFSISISGSRQGRRKKVLRMQADRQLPPPPACQALPEDCGDQFDSLIKDFHSAFVSATRVWAEGRQWNGMENGKFQVQPNRFSDLGRSKSTVRHCDWDWFWKDWRLHCDSWSVNIIF